MQNYIRGGYQPGLKDWIRFIFFNGTYSWFHLWFFPALIYCYMMYACVRGLEHKIKIRFVYSAAAILLFIQLLLGEGLSIFGIHISLCLIRNFLFLGFPFFMLGVLIHEKEKVYLSFFKDYILILFVIFGEIEAVVSGCLLGKNDLYIGTVFAVFAIFLLAVKGENLQYSARIAKLTSCSTYIYIIHPLIGWIGERTRNYGIMAALWNETFWPWIWPLVV